MGRETRSVLDVDVVHDPYTYFARLRESDPVHWSEPDGAWIITRYHDVLNGFRDDRLSSARIGPFEKELSPEQLSRLKTTLAILDGWMAFQDDPEHARLRAPLRRTFTPKRVQRLHDWVDGIVGHLLDQLPTDDPFDLVSRFAFPLPAIVIAELLGVPQEDRDEFKWWSDKLATLVVGTPDRPDLVERSEQASDEFRDYFVSLIHRYEVEPEDNLISALLSARSEGFVLSDQELVGACTLILFGGHETTANLIANSTLALLQHPAERERYAQHPELSTSAVEEFLRYDGPAKIMERRVAVPLELHGRLLNPGDNVFLAISSANRDERMFPEPDQFDIGRNPNPHLGFGHGRHFCLGAPLARLEVKIAIRRLFERFPRLWLVDDDLTYSRVVLGRSLRRLLVSAS